MIKYTNEICEYLKKNHKNKSIIELSSEINKIFNMNTTPENIQNLKSRITKRDGFVFYPARNDGCLKKGNIPWNKNTKGLTKRNITSFKKGNIPLNHRKVGEERISMDGYIEVKVSEPNKWELKHRILYKKYNGNIPDGHVIIFADGNKLNFDKNNLIAISRSENLILNGKSLRFNNQELTKSGILIAKVVDKINERKRK